MTLETFRSDDATATRTSKRAIGLKSKTTTLHVHHAFFLYILLPFVHDYGVKMPDLAFYGGRKQATTKLLFLFLNLDVVLTTSTPGVVNLHLTKYVDRSKKTERTMETERTQVHFLNDVFAAVAS